MQVVIVVKQAEVVLFVGVEKNCQSFVAFDGDVLVDGYHGVLLDGEKHPYHLFSLFAA